MMMMMMMMMMVMMMIMMMMIRMLMRRMLTMLRMLRAMATMRSTRKEFKVACVSQDIIDVLYCIAEQEGHSAKHVCKKARTCNSTAFATGGGTALPMSSCCLLAFQCVGNCKGASKPWICAISVMVKRCQEPFFSCATLKLRGSVVLLEPPLARTAGRSAH